MPCADMYATIRLVPTFAPAHCTAPNVPRNVAKGGFADMFNMFDKQGLGPHKRRPLKASTF